MPKLPDDNDRLRAGEDLDPEAGMVPVDEKGQPRAAPKAIGELFEAAMARMERRALGLERPIPMPPTWRAVAGLGGGGWWPGLHVLVGNTGSGKSQFALQS